MSYENGELQKELSRILGGSQFMRGEESIGNQITEWDALGMRDLSLQIGQGICNNINEMDDINRLAEQMGINPTYPVQNLNNIYFLESDIHNNSLLEDIQTQIDFINTIYKSTISNPPISLGQSINQISKSKNKHITVKNCISHQKSAKKRNKIEKQQHSSCLNDSIEKMSPNNQKLEMSIDDEDCGKENYNSSQSYSSQPIVKGILKQEKKNVTFSHSDRGDSQAVMDSSLQFTNYLTSQMSPKEKLYIKDLDHYACHHRTHSSDNLKSKNSLKYEQKKYTVNSNQNEYRQQKSSRSSSPANQCEKKQKELSRGSCNRSSLSNISEKKQKELSRERCNRSSRSNSCEKKQKELSRVMYNKSSRVNSCEEKQMALSRGYYHRSSRSNSSEDKQRELSRSRCQRSSRSNSCEEKQRELSRSRCHRSSRSNSCEENQRELSRSRCNRSSRSNSCEEKQRELQISQTRLSPPSFMNSTISSEQHRSNKVSSISNERSNKKKISSNYYRKQSILRKEQQHEDVPRDRKSAYYASKWLIDSKSKQQPKTTDIELINLLFDRLNHSHSLNN